MAELGSRRFVDYPVTGLFLDLRPVRTRRPGLAFLKKELSRLEKGVRPRSAEALLLAQDIGRLNEAVEAARGEKANCLAVYSSAKEGFLERFFWKLPPESELRIDNLLVRGFRPYVHPLALLADRLESFLLLVAGSREGRIFKVEAGRVSESWESKAELHPEIHREKGGAYDRRQGFARTIFSKHVEGHIDMHQEKLYHSLAEKARSWAQAAGIRSIVLAADASSGASLQAELARRDGRLVILVAPNEAKLSEAQRLAAGIRAFRKGEQEISLKRVDELFVSGRRRSILGASAVLDYLRTGGRAEVLVLEETFRKETFICGQCSAEAAGRHACPVCSGPVALSRLENELICLAAAAGTEIEFVKDSPRLAERGGVGLLV